MKYIMYFLAMDVSQNICIFSETSALFNLKRTGVGFLGI